MLRSITKTTLKVTTIAVGGLVVILAPRSMSYVVSTVQAICDRVDRIFENHVVKLHDDLEVESVDVIPEELHSISSQTLHDNVEEHLSVIGHKCVMHEEA